ncbi:hypothetical protein [Bacillus sp. V5-8f]|uniref:hypothetical protein n=1 Tax=Bacillus sp. V5-8f TaxID=2053044 RepID=UPI0015E08CCA|nr:hypothetical protein [Bacillus sp. V5-8f]
MEKEILKKARDMDRDVEYDFNNGSRIRDEVDENRPGSRKGKHGGHPPDVE